MPPNEKQDDGVIELTEIVEQGAPGDGAPAEGGKDLADLGGSGGVDEGFEQELEDLFSDAEDEEALLTGGSDDESTAIDGLEDADLESTMVLGDDELDDLASDMDLGGDEMDFEAALREVETMGSSGRSHDQSGDSGDLDLTLREIEDAMGDDEDDDIPDPGVNLEEMEDLADMEDLTDLDGGMEIDQDTPAEDLLGSLDDDIDLGDVDDLGATLVMDESPVPGAMDFSMDGGDDDNEFMDLTEDGEFTLELGAGSEDETQPMGFAQADQGKSETDDIAEELGLGSMQEELVFNEDDDDEEVSVDQNGESDLGLGDDEMMDLNGLDELIEDLELPDQGATEPEPPTKKAAPAKAPAKAPAQAAPKQAAKAPAAPAAAEGPLLERITELEQRLAILAGLDERVQTLEERQETLALAMTEKTAESDLGPLEQRLAVLEEADSQEAPTLESVSALEERLASLEDKAGEPGAGGAEVSFDQDGLADIVEQQIGKALSEGSPLYARLAGELSKEVGVIVQESCKSLEDNIVTQKEWEIELARFKTELEATVEEAVPRAAARIIREEIKALAEAMADEDEEDEEDMMDDDDLESLEALGQDIGSIDDLDDDKGVEMEEEDFDLFDD